MNPVKEAAWWLAALKQSKRDDEKFITRGRKIVKRYRDERSDRSLAKRFNILWANIQTLLPALYGKTPRAQVERRFKDQDPIGRTAAQILERCLQYEIDHYTEFDANIRAAILDRLLPGRGVAWVRFDEQGPKTCVDYVFWEDFRCSSARVWDEVTWLARRTYLTRQEGLDRFGNIFKNVPLADEPIGLEDDRKDQEQEKKAKVWEIWDKSQKKVIWVCEGFDQALDKRDDPYGLDDFWPCPKPLFSTQTTDTIVPVPDFTLYQDQADEIDQLTTRIGLLVRALKMVGVYDASQPEIKRMLTEGMENSLIPVDKWAMLAEKKGLQGVVEWMPLEMVVSTLQSCYEAREQAKQVIYEVIGLSDIIRGSSVASETATAQQIKSQYASLRLKRTQLEVALFVSEVMRIKAQMMCDLYPPELLVEMSGIEGTRDAQYAQQALQMIKTEPLRSFRIEVASDSLVELDEQAEKESRIEFLTAAGGFLERAANVAQVTPDLTPLMAEMLMFGVRAYRGGRQMEAAFEDAMAKMTAPKEPAPPQPSPEEIKAQSAIQLESMRGQQTTSLEQIKQQSAAQIEEYRAAQARELEAMRAESAANIEAMRQQAETERSNYRVELDAQTKKEIAGMNAAASEKPAVQIDGGLSEVGEALKESQAQTTEMLAQGLGQLAEATQALAGAAQEMARPKVRRGKRLPTGELEITEV